MNAHAEAYVPAQTPPSEADARLSGTNAHSRWPQRPASTPTQGAQAAHRLDDCRRVVPGNGMRRAQRLRKREDFAAVYRHGRPYRSELLILRALHTGQPLSRFGFTVGHALGKAVVRNRLKRRLREAARSFPVAPGWDLVVNARRGAQEADYHRLRSVFGELMGRAAVLRDEEPRE